MLDFDQDFVEKLLKKDKNTFNKFYLQTVDVFYRYLRGRYFLTEADSQDLLSTFYMKVWN